jgi:replicative DNA helicase
MEQSRTAEDQPQNIFKIMTQEPKQIEMPTAPDAEAALLICLIENPQRFGKLLLASNINADYYSSPSNAEMLRIITQRLKDQLPLDPTSIKEQIRGKKHEPLSIAHLTSILSTEYSEEGWEGYVAVIREAKAKRTLLEASTASLEMSGEEALSALRKAHKDAQNELQGSSEVQTAKEAVKAFVKAMRERSELGSSAGLKTGVEQIDTHTGGMRKGELWVVGAKTSGGKSILMLQMATEAILAGKRVLIFSLELGSDEIINRMISFQARVSMGELTGVKPYLVNSTLKIKAQADELAKLNFSICDTANMTMDQIEGHCIREYETNGLDLVIIDYLQQISTPKIKGQNREQEVANISRSCKQLAKRVKCPVLTATQLNDNGQARESRAIEHDSDNILIVENIPDGRTELVFWKCRNGERGKSFEARLNGEFQRFDFNPRY